MSNIGKGPASQYRHIADITNNPIIRHRGELMKRKIMHIQLSDNMCLDIEHEVLLTRGVIISLSRVELRMENSTHGRPT